MADRIFNLDQFISNEYVITWGGEEYHLDTVTTGNMLEFMAMADKAGTAKSARDMWEVGKTALRILCPTFPADSVPIRGMRPLLDFIQEALGEVAEQSVNDSQGEAESQQGQ